jgi:hypothetical protein
VQERDVSDSIKFHVTIHVAARVPLGTDLHDLERRARELLTRTRILPRLEKLLVGAGGTGVTRAATAGWPKHHFGTSAGVICGMIAGEDTLTTSNVVLVDCKACCRKLFDGGMRLLASERGSVIPIAAARRKP